jgi:hypothetical protein
MAVEEPSIPETVKAFGSHKPNVGTRPATNLQQVNLLAIGNAVDLFPYGIPT